MEQEKGNTSIFKSGLKRKTLLLTSILMLMVILVQLIRSFTFLDSVFDQDIAYVESSFDINIKTAVETLISALDQNYQLYLDGDISEETAMDIAKHIVRDTRYSSGASGLDDGYFWADMADGFCAVHYNPANEGKMRWDWVDQEGTYYIREFIRLGDEGGGYLDFYFGKPGDENGSYKKRGYTKKFEPYGWYISTGNYYEDTDAVLDKIKSLKHTDFVALFGISFFTVLIGLFLVSVNLNRVVTPIVKLSKRVHELSMGDTALESFNITTQKDEIGDLNESLNEVVRVLHKLLENINVMISEHAKGNIDYIFDTNDFLGDYKRLADSVLELASFGMKDTLTAIPNRRTFDNRLDLEWDRAKREQTPISIIMIDIDKFKTYNDTFGHQQGDMALKTVAATIQNSLKRTIDFCARWGGEEFTVLLSNTSSTGALSVAESIRAAIENAVIPCTDEKGQKTTVSLGVNSQTPDMYSSIADFISGADASLYKAKETGRNRVCLYDPSDDAQTLE